MMSNLRIGGLASGMDIDQLVSDLMKVQRAKVDKLGQNKQILEWQQEEYREFNNSLRALRDSAFNMKLQGTYLAKNAVSTNDALKVSANTNAPNGTYQVTVQSLATGVSRGSQEALAEEANSDGTVKKLSEQFGLSGTVTFELAGSTGSRSFSFDTAQKTIYDVVSEINGAKLGIVASYDADLNRFFLNTDSTGSDAKIKVVTDDAHFLSNVESSNSTLKLDLYNIYLQGSTTIYSVTNDLKSLGFNQKNDYTFSLQGALGSQTITCDRDTTIQELINNINTSYTGINAAFELQPDGTGRFVLKDADGVSNPSILVNLDDDQNLFSDVLGLPLVKGTVVTSTVATGTNAVVDFGDVAGLEFATNTFMINGITVTASEPNVSADVTVSNDTDKVFDSIKSFIELYNSTIDDINKKINEKRYRDYLPLTDEQREQLSDEQEKQWEEKAKSGLLKNDSLLAGAVYRMRTSMSTIVDGVYNTNYDTLAEIGIKTGNYSERGKLHIDEAKLKEALVKDPQAVMELFVNSSDNNGEKGIAVRLYDDLTASITMLTGKAGMDVDFSQYDNSIIGKQIEGVNEDINSWEDRLKSIEDRYWRQFTAMEEAMQRMNSQSAWLSNQLGTGQQ